MILKSCMGLVAFNLKKKTTIIGAQVIYSKQEQLACNLFLCEDEYSFRLRIRSSL